MKEIDFSGIKKRDDIIEQVLPKIKEKRIINFILKNLKREENSFKWKLNIDTIIEKLDDIIEDIEIADSISGFPCLFIKGENSDYILQDDIAFIKEKFPVAEIITIKNAGHWIHAEQPSEFIKIVSDFLDD